MKRKFIFIVSLFLSMVVTAGNVTTEQAEEIAAQFLNKHHPSPKRQSMRMAKRQPLSLNVAADATAYYAFNVGSDDGYVIVSGSDLAPQVLAYATSGTFKQESIPTNMQAWLDGYADQIAYLEKTGGKYEAPRLSIARNAISPLLTSTWNQGAPYNNMCPVDPTTGDRCVTGCVATALAQVINYYKYPNQTIDVIPAYTTATRSIDMPEIGITTIDWDNMLDSYTGTESAAQKEAIAQLMLLCGQAVEMDYASNGSGVGSLAYDVKALLRYFGYDLTTRVLERNAFGKSEWETLIYNELSENRPVLYGGGSTGGGHAFVIDGYNEEGLFHVNWGWSGNCDGYFSLSVLNPDSNSGIGASSSSDGYSFDQQAIIGIQRGTSEAVAERFTVTAIENIGDLTYTRSSAKEDFTGISIQPEVWNMTSDTHSFVLNLALMDGDNNWITSISDGVNFGSTDYESGGAYAFEECSFGADLPDGEYYIVPVSGSENSMEWEPCWRSNVYRIKAVINGNTLTLEEPNVDLSATIKTTGTAIVGHSMQLTAQITNNGSYFNDYIYIYAGGIQGGRAFEAREGETVSFDIDFKPLNSGSEDVYLCYFDSQTGELTPFASTTVSAKKYLDYSLCITNGSGGVVTDGSAKVAVSITNNGTEYNGQVALLLYKLSGNSYSLAEFKELSLTLVNGTSTTLNFTFDSLENSQRYLLSFRYLTANKLIDDGGYATFSTFSLKEGDVFTLTTEEGVSVVCKVNSTTNKTCQIGMGEKSASVSAIGDNATGGAVNYIPYGNWSKYSTTQMLYTADEIGQSGLISSIAFWVDQASSHSTSELKVYLGHKSGKFSSVSDYVSSGNLTLVYSGTKTLGTSTGWETLYFNQSNFYYNGTDNLVVVIARKSSSKNLNLLYGFRWEYGAGYTLYRTDDYTTGYGNVTSTYAYSQTSYRPNVRIGISTIPLAISTSTTGTVTIPSAIGSYTITKIAEKAFEGCTRMTGVSIPSTIATIGSAAFNNCSSLTTVKVGIKSPVSIVSSTFSNRANATLYVPQGCKTSYKAASYWKEFKEIIEPQAQSLNLTELPIMTYGDYSYRLPSTTTEGQTLTWRSSDTSVASINSNTLTVKNAGTATITAEQAGTERYLSFMREYTLTVKKAVLTVTAQNASKLQGEENPVLGISYEGFKNGDDETSLMELPVVSTTATKESPAGEYPITVSGGAAENYNFEYVEGTLTVIATSGDTDIANLDNALYIEPTEVLVGIQNVLPIMLKNNVDVAGISFTLSLPDGFSLATDDGDLVYSLNNSRAKTSKFSLFWTENSDNSYSIRIMATSTTTISGTEGTILNLALIIDNGISSGNYQIALKENSLSVKDSEGTLSTQDLIETRTTLTVIDAILGDVNRDGRVDLTDAIMIVYKSLGQTQIDFVESAADVNRDNRIDLTDAIIVVYKSLGVEMQTKVRLKKSMREPE